jgi:hypothetical protein
MKRMALLVAVGALVLGAAWPAMAQAPAFTVTFGGQFRAAGIAFNNIADFTDTDTAACTQAGLSCKDSDSFMHERFRLFTTVESADKKARVYWALEIGDLAFGAGGGASGAEYGGTTTRVGNGSGGGLGNDGVNVETKNLYLWFEIPGVPGLSALIGMHNIVWLNQPVGAFLDDDAMGIQLNWKSDFMDVQLWMAKADENNRQDADDNDLYAARFGINVTPDIRITVEGLGLNSQCFARRSVVLGGTCVSSDPFDTFWVGTTVGAKVGTINLDGTFVYGQRQLYSALLDRNVEEKGWGVNFTARVPIGPVSTWFNAWYTTGDERRPVGTPRATGAPSSALNVGQDFSTVSNTTRLNQDSDKLPVPIAGASWLGAPFIGELLNHSRTTGNISFGQPLYNDWSGTWGVGGSAIYAILPSLSVGGGVAFVAPSETNNSVAACNSIFCDWAFEIDGGVLWTVNPQLSMQLVGSYILPDGGGLFNTGGDDAWGVVWRTLFAF